ncbi:MAG: hypothetical protein ACI8WT_003005 [Clostridium sp.]|jgi:hypothetical protein
MNVKAKLQNNTKKFTKQQKSCIIKSNNKNLLNEEERNYSRN